MRWLIERLLPLVAGHRASSAPHIPDFLGRRAEKVVAWRLRLTGWQILERRWRCRLGEIDIIARRGGVLVFVEVKFSNRGSAGLYRLSRKQQGRLRRAAGLWLAKNQSRYLGCDIFRHDIAVVGPSWWQLEYLQNVI